jgi:hypothetical protein
MKMGSVPFNRHLILAAPRLSFVVMVYEESMKRFLLNLIIFILMPCASLAKDECTPNLVDYDVCKDARKLADEFAKLLPMRMSQDMMLEKVFAIQNMVSLTAVLGYEKQYLESVASQGGVTMEVLEGKMRKSTMAYICQPKSSTAPAATQIPPPVAT